MCCSLWTIAVGLFLTLAGIIVTFVLDPPRRKTLNRKTFMHAGVERSLHPPTPPGPSVEEVERKEDWKLKFSFFGVGLLVLGTILQLVGTICQIVLLAGRK
jgi:hypothetical protein